MSGSSYLLRREQIETYFDRTAADAWSKLTSDVKVSRIRATVRAGRAQMRATLLDWLPADLAGARVLDAGCGTGALAVEAARRGAHVVAIDISPTLIDLARARTPRDLGCGKVEFRVGDMLDPGAGGFDHVVAMDSLIHYRSEDVVRALVALGGLCADSILFTFAPRTPLLAMMHGLGRLFPRQDRAPAIEPAAVAALHRQIARDNGLVDWRIGRDRRVARGFYTSQAQELCHR